MLYCPKCSQEKLETEFHKNKRTKSGYQSLCKECRLAFYQLNQERLRAEQAAAYPSRKAKYNAAARARYKANPDKYLTRATAYTKSHPEGRKAICRTYRENNKGYYASKCAARRARRLKATPPWLTAEHHAEMKLMYETAAFLTDLLGVQHHVDHKHPLQAVNACGLHVPWNLQILTATENISKGNRWQDD
jgi:5-methylcytosine-specific restriction endonuclease McrA